MFWRTEVGAPIFYSACPCNFRTLLDEELGYRPDLIEQQLAHVQKDPNGRAYNRTKHLAQRREMMQCWADYLDKIKGKVEV